MTFLLTAAPRRVHANRYFTMMQLRALPLACAAASLILAGCASDQITSSEPATATLAITGVSAPKLFSTAQPRLGLPARELLVNANGSLRIWTEEHYNSFKSLVAPSLELWAADARLNLNPNYIAAVLAKESGFQQYAISFAPANGYPQMTHIADVDLQQRVAGTLFDWMAPEVFSWARHPAVHSSSATKANTESLIASGRVTAANEYFFDPLRSTRGGVFWLRILQHVWTEDAWPGGYGSFARERLNGGAPLTEEQLFDLVTVSYNRGYPFVRDMVQRYGRSWTSHLAAHGAEGLEAADYLERVRAYTSIFQDAAASGSGDSGDSVDSGDGGGSDIVAGPTVPNAPTGATATRPWAGIVVSWTDASSNETGFRVYRSMDGGPYVLYATVGAGVTSYGDGDVWLWSTYQYAVGAFNEAGESPRALTNALLVQ